METFNLRMKLFWIKTKILFLNKRMNELEVDMSLLVVSYLDYISEKEIITNKIADLKIELMNTANQINRLKNERKKKRSYV